MSVIQVSRRSPLPDRPTPRGILKREQRRRQAEFHRRVVARDGGKCTKCGRTVFELVGVYPDLKQLIADHILPESRGGTNETSNGQTLCFLHNLSFGWRARYSERND